MIRGLAILLAIAAAPAAQAADWTAPFTVMADGSATGVSVASDAGGGMIAVWQHDTRRAQPPRDGGFGGVESYVRARAIGPDRRRSAIQTLSITDDLTASPAVAADRRGGAVAVWTQPTKATVTPSWQPRAHQIGPSGAGRPWDAPIASWAARRKSP